MKSWLAGIAAAVLLASCATSAPEVHREALTRQIADDAAGHVRLPERVPAP